MEFVWNNGKLVKINCKKLCFNLQHVYCQIEGKANQLRTRKENLQDGKCFTSISFVSEDLYIYQQYCSFMHMKTKLFKWNIENAQCINWCQPVLCIPCVENKRFIQWISTQCFFYHFTKWLYTCCHGSMFCLVK